MLRTMIATQDPMTGIRRFTAAETEYGPTLFIAETERIGFFDETAGVSAHCLDFAGFLVFAFFACRHTLKVCPNALGEAELDGIHSGHFVDQFFEKAVFASSGWIA